ncbi:hypothetical protein SDC9_145218 [bioreactor metagenome]|uniref:Uncharacterized protein n=1 Tax=bioreactor metagenome TaxID=1076179 RepID=A0A645E810_9ZZZZ
MARERRTGFVFSSTSNVAESILRNRTLIIDTMTMQINIVKLFLTVKIHPPLRTTDEGWGMHNKNV